MSGNAAQEARIFVLHLALDDAVPEAAIVGRWRDGVLQRWRGIECRMRHTERTEDFALAGCVEGFVGQAFEGDAKEDETNVAVLCVRARRGDQVGGEGGLQQLSRGVDALK